MNRFIVLFIGLLMTHLPGWADPAQIQAQVVEIEVTGMTCPFCVYGTEKKLNKLPGVDAAEVSLKNKKARILMKPGEKAEIEAIRKAIVDAGFTPGEATVDTSRAAK